jgi:hypothetical protein
MSATQFFAAFVSTVLAISGAGSWLMLRCERKYPTAYPAQQRALEAAGVESMDGWHALSTVKQEAADTASLDRAEQAEIDAAADARDAAEFQAHLLQINALHRP